MKVTSGLRAWVRFITMLGYYDNGRNAHNQRSVECNYMILNLIQHIVREISMKKL